MESAAPDMIVSRVIPARLPLAVMAGITTLAELEGADGIGFNSSI